MREKPANEAVVQRLIDYMNRISWQLKGEGADVDFKYLQKEFGVAKRTYSDLKALKIISFENKRHVFKAALDLRTLALKILDYRLKKNKKTVHYPIPGLADIADSLKQITERLMQLSVQHERLLKQPKNDIKGSDQDLFRIDDQRLFVIGCLLPSVHSNTSAYPHTGMKDRNFLAIEIADDLLNQLLKRGNELRNQEFIKKVQQTM